MLTHEQFSRRGGKARARNNNKSVLSNIGLMGAKARWAGHTAKRPSKPKVAEAQAV